MNATTRLGAALLAVMTGLAGGACAPGGPPPDALIPDQALVEQNLPLGGDSLAMRKREMRRAHGDLVHFLATLRGLQQRKDRNGQALFRDFVDRYLGGHLGPLLEADWPSEHPELLGLDANSRFVQAELLMRMRDAGRAQKVVDEIERRFAGHDGMLVDYPVGQQHPLERALEILNDRKWRG